MQGKAILGVHQKHSMKECSENKAKNYRLFYFGMEDLLIETTAQVK
uniref:Uncharacterized protein n=1 Tax=Arundo donax TaxID=35708 RepID=A0A0A8ZG12_ARUDO